MTPALAREILQRSGEHMLLVALAVALALLIALPLGVAIRERPQRRRLARQLYAERLGLRLFPSLGFENTFAILIRQADGQRLGLRTLSQAVAPARRWRAAFGYEFLNRPDGYPGLARR